MKGTLVLVIGPTGSGKSALISYVRKAIPGLVFPVSCNTRAMRPEEVEGENYFFITPEEFEKRVQAGEFLEWARVDDRRYGTLKSQIIPPLEQDKVVVREVEVQGARSILALLPRKNIKFFFIDGGTWDDLEKRILARASMGEAELASRRQRFIEETKFKSEADIVIHNEQGKLEEAKQAFEKAIRAIVAA